MPRLSRKETEFLKTITGNQPFDLVEVRVQQQEWLAAKLPDGTRVVAAMSGRSAPNLFAVLVLRCPHCVVDVFSEQRITTRLEFKAAHAHPTPDLSSHCPTYCQTTGEHPGEAIGKTERNSRS